MYKRKYTCGADKKKKKNREELEKCANDKRQTKLCFTSRTKGKNIIL